MLQESHRLSALQAIVSGLYWRCRRSRCRTHDYQNSGIQAPAAGFGGANFGGAFISIIFYPPEKLIELIEIIKSFQLFQLIQLILTPPKIN